jgi:multiple sugar transport system substrate-binding protein
VVVAAAGAGGYYATKPKPTPTPITPAPTTPAPTITEIITQTITPTITPGKPYAGEKITVGLVSGLVTDPLTKSLVPLFEELTGIKVEVETLPYPALHEKQVLSLSAPKGQGLYDIFEIYNEAIAEYTVNNWVLDLKSFPTFEEDFAGIHPKARYICEWEGKIVGMPFDGGGRVFCYNKKLLEDAGLEIPPVDGWTWEYVREAAIEVKRYYKGEVWGWVHQGLMGGYSCMDFNPWLWGFGGEIFDNYTIPTKCLINSPQAVEALEEYAAFRNEYKVSPPGDTTYSETEAVRLICEGKVAMSINDPLMHGQKFWNPSVSRVVGQIFFADNPLKKGITPMHEGKPFLVDGKPAAKHRIGIWELNIAANSVHQGAAYEFLKWITGESIAKTWFLGGAGTFRMSVFEDPTFKGQYGYFDYIPRWFATGIRWVHNPEATATMIAIGEAVTSVLSGEKKAQEALDIAKDKIDKLYYGKPLYPDYKP